jgi:F420-dependent oxidoreductase-like protein
MRLALHFPSFTLPGAPESLAATLAATARAADQGGCAAFTLMDHYFQMETLATAHDPMLEGYTALGFLAGCTERIDLGLLVTGVTYRHPGLLAKIVTTLDVLSGGRAVLGLGASWYEREHVGLGVPFPPVAERFERLEEALQVCRQMWSDDDGAYDGQHYRLAETICSPRPLRRPHPPVMVGGDGERRTLRLVARYADACNVFGADVETVAHKMRVLDRHCEEAGRDPAEVARTVISGDDAFGPEFLPRMQGYAAHGVEQVWVSPAGPDPAGWVARLTEQVLPRLSEI